MTSQHSAVTSEVSGQKCHILTFFATKGKITFEFGGHIGFLAAILDFLEIAIYQAFQV